MKRSSCFNLLIALSLVLALGGISLIVGRVLAQEPWPQGALTAQDAVGTAFTYQGRLLDGGNPVDGNLDFFFTLWDAPSGGDLVAEQVATGVEVSDGHFSVSLDFGSDAFTGDARYLAIEVEGTPLEPLVALTAAPYAHSLRPGAVINSGTGSALTLHSSGGGATLSVSNATQDGLLVTSAGDDGLEVSSASYGVYVNAAAQDALKVNNAGDDGLDIYDAGDAPTHTLPADLFPPQHDAHDGIDIAGAKDYGLWVGYAGGAGVRINSAGYGVFIDSVDNYGLTIKNSGDRGIWIDRTGKDGVAISHAAGNAVYASSDGGYGLQTPNQILVNGCIGCTSMLVAQNGDEGDLELGDVVVLSGVGRPFADSPDPTCLVRRAEQASSAAVAGVVYGRITAFEETRDSRSPEGQGQTELTTHWQVLPPEEAPAAPGEYLVIVTMGLTRVKAEAVAGPILPGDLLATSADGGRAIKAEAVRVEGAAFYPPGTIIGKAMEPLKKGSGLLWALVTLQ